MLFSTTIALLFCLSAVSIHGLEKCPGASSDSQDDFQSKFDAAPIVIYGTVSEIKNTDVKLTVNCVLKGSVPVSTVEVPQLSEVSNLTECHYLTTNKNYIVFLESMKTTGADAKSIYKLADMEEIEINGNTLKNFMTNECDDEDDYGIEMTVFYADNNLKCNKLTATCNEKTKSSILALNYPPLTKATTVLGGFKKILPVPNMGPNDDGTIAGKNTGGIADEHFRSTATFSTIWNPIIVFIAGLLMMFNI